MMKLKKPTRIIGALAAALAAAWIAGCASHQHEAHHEHAAVSSGSADSGTAVQTTGVPGSASATTTISGKQLPAPDPKFGGVIKDNALQSKAWWAPRVVPPKKAPNIRLIMTDDSGFGVPSTYGGVIPTPAMDRIANAGLKYPQFHSVALCSPTRAALITGRNHHSVGFGVISEQS